MKQKTVVSIILVVIIAVSCMLSSCITTPVTISPSNTPLVGKEIVQNLGKTEGSSSPVFSVFGLWMIGRPDMEEAVTNAIKAKKGDALINIRCYESYLWLVLIGLTEVTVEGEAVKLGEKKDDTK